MANYYGFGTGSGNQHYSMGAPGSYNNPTFGVQQPPAGPGQQFITPAGAQTQPVQQQQTYMAAYGHVRPQGSSSASTQYQNSYNYGSGGPAPQQQANYNKPASQPQQYYQQTSSSASTAWGNSSNMNVKTQPQPPAPPSRQTMYANNGSSNYNQPVGNVVAQQQVTISTPSTQGIQGSPSVNFRSSKAPTPTTSNNNKSSYGQPHSGRPQNMSNYEKALISAANSIYQQQHKGGGGGDSSGANVKNLPYWKQKRIQAQQNRDPNKPIIASEVKAYLYAWLGKERTRPEYNITAHGTSPYRHSYVCEVIVPGFPYVGKGTAGNKKDSQTRAAWDFCDYLVRENKMKESELPIRESRFKASSNQLPAGYKSRPDAEIIASVTKKKVVSNKINFVGGSTLHLSNNQTDAKAEIGPVAYPAMATQPAKPLAPIKVEVAPQTTDKVKLIKLSEKSTGAFSVTQRDGGEAAALKNDPIGENYVDQVWTDGRVIRYRCKLCECEFNDPSARELHVRGRRHKLSYKKKVDPSIEVDVKLNPKQKSLMMIKMKQEARKEAIREQRKKEQQWKIEMRKMEEEDRRLYEEELYYQYQEEMVQFEEQVEFHRRRGIPVPQHILTPVPPVLRFFRPPAMAQSQQLKTIDDQHVLNKHSQIYPTEEELTNVQTAVQTVEAALKEVSTTIHEQEMKVFTASNLNGKKPQPERLLKAVLRIGALAKGLLLRGNLSVELVLMCNQKPSNTLLNRVADHMPKHLGIGSETKMTMEISYEECGFLLRTTTQPCVTIKVVLTATQMRPIEEGAGATKSDVKPDPPDILDREKCCRALAALRHAKWFQAKANGLQSCVLVTRIMKDLCVRVPTWSPLISWAVELLCERVISSATLPLSPSAALQRVFEALAAGVLLPGGPGVMDPCERKPTDAAAALTSQEREDITASAQHALRLLSVRNIHKVLGMEPILSSGQRAARKRSQDENIDSKLQIKKLKAEKMD
uniref:ZF(C2H2)-54 zinc finger protein n=1 Tax=Phallusia mammillata TaxID=59560 RepID=A0A6F9DXS8_9ASCI|nr:ZF(C2H2)-54 zinc finger protein [Phallusia mammillata]